MKNLWRKSLELLWKYPVLWLPFVCGELLISLLELLRSDTSRQITRWAMTQQQASGGAARPFGFAYQSLAMFMNLPIMMGTSVAEICIITVSLVLTSTLVRIILSNPQNDQSPIYAAQLLADLASDRKRILMFVLKYFLVGAVIFGAIVIPVSYLVFKGTSGGAFGNVVSAGEAIVTGFIWAWVMAPLAIRLLRPADSEDVSSDSKRLGRHAAMITVVALVLLGQLIVSLFVRLKMNPRHLGTIPGILERLVIGSPMAFLFVVLALIASETRIEPYPRNRSIRRVLATLMPLHFGGGKGE